MRKIIGLILLLIAAPSCSATWSFVQGKACNVGAASDTCSYSSSVTQYNLLVVYCGFNRAGLNASVTDDLGDGFKLIGGTLTKDTSGILNWGVWYTTATATNLTVVTCADLNSNTTSIQMAIHEYAGNAFATDPFDLAVSSIASVSATTTSIVSGYAAPSRNGELAFAVAVKMPGNPTVGNGTIRTTGVFSTFYATEDAALSTSDVYQSSFTFVSGSNTNLMTQIFFLPPVPAPRGIETWQ
jgi:hypothetical protein